MKITSLMTEDIINLDLQGQSQDAVMDEMVDMLAEAGHLSQKEAFKQALYDREQESSTGIGFSIAIPHGKSAAVESPRVAFGLHQQGVDWNSMDGTDAHLIFMIAVPSENAGDEHLKILQQLSRKLMDGEFRESLKNVKSKEAVLKLVEEIG
ncbi:fructose PTS transporter subunit IIA [Tuberibacillus sp. Marseille-P3662]|uniref:PTS sugar transporter subunit IIA n=1 Tax=Tuberibacillus sp. Marseille-P3662 TaxID=1965358 RepID=UPI001593B66D